MSVAPDYAEPFEAWRVWRVVRRDGEYSLGSVIQRALWPAGEAFTADCLRAPRLFSRFRRKQPHEAPDARCECGIYAAALERVGQYLADAPFRGVARVLGKVALWGTVIECDRGFRASLAYPTRIYIPIDAGRPWRVDWEEVAIGLWRYGVPVEALASSSADAPRLLAELQAAA
jgi:hypothetical protein